MKLEDVSNYVSQNEMSLIERGQVIDGLTVVMEKLDGGGVRELRVATSLLEIMIVTLKNNQATDEDTSLVFQRNVLWPEKYKKEPPSSANESDS